MKTILVPTDFSKSAENALYYAIELAKKNHAKIILLHASHINATDYIIPMDILKNEHEKEDVKNDLLAKKELIKIEHAGNIECEYIDTDQEVINGIVKTIDEKKIDMVIMGTKGSQNILNELFGSNTSKLIQRSNVPVIAVPENYTSREIKKITYATAFYSTDVKAIKRIVEIAKLYHAQVNILHVISDDMNYATEKDQFRNFMNEVNQKINYQNISFQIIQGKNVTDGIENYIKTNDTNIMVMSTQQRNFFERLFQKSNTKKVALNSEIPLMAIHHLPVKSIKFFN
jgi:nucleotide-binding universal stress UspA family protein